MFGYFKIFITQIFKSENSGLGGARRWESNSKYCWRLKRGIDRAQNVLIKRQSAVDAILGTILCADLYKITDVFEVGRQNAVGCA